MPLLRVARPPNGAQPRNALRIAGVLIAAGIIIGKSRVVCVSRMFAQVSQVDLMYRGEPFLTAIEEEQMRRLLIASALISVQVTAADFRVDRQISSHRSKNRGGRVRNLGECKCSN